MWRASAPNRRSRSSRRARQPRQVHGRRGRPRASRMIPGGRLGGDGQADGARGRRRGRGGGHRIGRPHRRADHHVPRAAGRGRGERAGRRGRAASRTGAAWPRPSRSARRGCSAAPSSSAPTRARPAPSIRSSSPGPRTPTRSSQDGRAGAPIRSLKTKFTRKLAKLEHEEVSREEFERMAAGQPAQGGAGRQPRGGPPSWRGRFRGS